MATVGPDINIGGKGLAVIWALNAVSITVVIARCMTQRFIIRQLGLSDALVVVSMGTISSMAALITVQYHYGWGRHYAYLDPFDRIEAMKYNAIGQSFGVMGSTFGRMSFIILMLQLFGTSKLKHAALWTLFWVQFIPNCVVVVTLYVQCNDIRALWDTSIVSSCWPESYQTYIGYAHTSWNGLTDLFLTCLPATMLWSLQMNRRTKFGLVFLLSLSLLAFVGVIMKIVYIRVLANRGDYTYNTVPFFVWVQVESNLVVIASSVPLLRPLFVRLRAGNFSTQNGSTAPTFEMSGYSNKRKSIQNNHMFSEISDDDLGLKDSRDGMPIDDKGSEDHILPIQGEKERVLEPWVVKKEVSYSVRVEKTVDEDIEKGEPERDRGRNNTFMVPKRASKGSMSILSHVSMA
ncbi:putative integral membrane protein [Botrytis fragariae]|uniref:Putative integral membrane protein n=1 Tax=Botrytis fragariae TaxID=1964551 RepID=A0A8H6ARY6_9HELO|nr:putative integral membrane protein [Botrytis fragariae]KAF5872517.1 putative integral membrane protein [Botrytis fragariae]